MQRITENSLSTNKEVAFPRLFLYGVHQMYVLVQKRMEKKLSEAKTLSFSQYWVLVCLLKSQEQNQATIAKLMHITEATISRHIKTLEKQKYLEKDTDKQNKSKNIIKLTQTGVKEYGKAKKIIEHELDKIFKVVDTRDRKKILTNFDKIISKLLESK